MAIRKESVELSLNDLDFTTGMAKAAAQTALLNRELDKVDGTSIKADRSTRALADGGIKKTGDSSRKSADDLNKYTGRLNLLVSAAVGLGPALIPISAAAIPAVAGLAAGFGAAAGAAGVALLAFHGIGDGLKALDKYALEPTAANLQALNEKMAALGPQGQEFAHFLADLQPQLKTLQATAQAGLLPGVEDGIKSLLPLLPQVQSVVSTISTELGSLTARAGNGLANDSEFKAFFSYVEREAKPTLEAFGKATGNVAAGLAQLMVDVEPLSTDFAQGLVHATESFRQWADGLQQTQGFRDFLAYVETEGPQVARLIGGVGNALVGIAEAAAPIGADLLPVLTALANIIGIIGKSPLGPVIYTGVAATIAFNRGAALMSGLLTKLTGQTAALAAEMSGLAVAETEAAAAGAGVGAAAGGARGAGLAAAAGKYGPLAAILGAEYLGNKYSGIQVDQSHISSQSQVNKLGQNVSFNSGSYFGTHSIYDLSNIAGITSPNQARRNNVSQADTTLSQMVSAGQGAQAASTFAAISAAAQKAGASVADVRKQFPQYAAAAKAAVSATAAAATQTDNAAQAQQQYAASLKATTDAHLGAFDAETNYRQALAAAEAQAKKSNAGFKGNSAEVLANRQALSGLAGAWKTQIQAMADNGASADKIKAKYAAARQELIATATGMGATAAQARRYANQLLQIPGSVTTKITASVDDGSLGALEDRLSRLAGKHTKTYVDVVQQGATGKQIALQQKADGGFISGPGTGTSDSIPAYLSNGEYVMRAAAVNKYGPAMFDRLNAMHFANGGPVRSSVDATSGQKSYYLPFGSKANWGDAEKYAKAEKAVDRLGKHIDALTNTLSKPGGLNDQLQTAQGKLSSLTGAVSGNLTRSLFSGGSGGSVFGQSAVAGSPAFAISQLQGQLADAQALPGLIDTLKLKGITGAALGAILSDAGMPGLKMFAAADAGTDAQFNSLYNSATSAVTYASGYAGQATGLQASVDALTAQVADFQAQVTHTTNQQTRAQKQATKAKAALSAKQAKQTGQHVAKELNHTAKRAKNR